MTASTDVLEWLEAKRSTLFLAAGGVLVVYASLLGYQVFIDSSMNFHDNEAAVVGPAGFFLGSIGLLGLYPTLSSQRSRLARAGAVFAVFGVIGWFAITVDGLAHLAGIDRPVWFQALGFLAFLEMLVGFPLFGIVSLQADIHSKVLGVLLVAPAVIFGTMILSGAVTGGTGIGAVLISSGLTLTHLSIGYLLRTGDGPAAHAEPTADATP